MFFTMCHIVCPIVQYQHGVYHRQAVAKTSYDCGPHSLALSLSDAIIASQFLQWQLTAAHIWSLFDDKQVGFEAAPKGCQETGVMSIVCIAAGRQFQLVGPLTARLHCPAILQVHDTYNMWAGVDCRCHWPDAVVMGVTSTLESLHVETLTLEPPSWRWSIDEFAISVDKWQANPNRDWYLNRDLNTFDDSICGLKVLSLEHRPLTCNSILIFGDFIWTKVKSANHCCIQGLF